ncbi:MAG TPA: CAP domain-containing protein [Polyangia bacterium]|nr:CAP domain-containing protein [Polyangia bacterium]
MGPALRSGRARALRAARLWAAGVSLCVALVACAPPPGSGVAGSPIAAPPASPAPPPVSSARPSAAETLFVPAGPGARAYASSPAEVRRSAPPVDPLRGAILDDARAAARRAGRTPPVGDVRLDWVMTDLARNVRGDDLPALEAVDFLLSYYGLPEPAPHLLLARATAGADQQVRDQARAATEALLRVGAIDRVGVGVERVGGDVYVAVGLQETHLDLLSPVPRHLPRGGRASIGVRIDAGYRGPQLVVTAPDGTVHEDAPSAQASRLASELRCGADGRYQVEIAATGTAGPAVLANFPIYCGVDPPARSPRAAGTHPGAADPDQAERQMLALVNRDRLRAGLRPVAADARLAAIARAHSRDMVEHDFVGHVSPRTGTAMDRVRRAGLSPALVMENVGRAYDADEAEDGFLSSPGHRGNLLDPHARLVGIGIVFGPVVTGTRPLFVTQLFTD